MAKQLIPYTSSVLALNVSFLQADSICLEAARQLIYDDWQSMHHFRRACFALLVEVPDRTCDMSSFVVC